ncbi:MAG TPA: asparagine--tRNA ligase [Longimicrobiales bacterium]|nr:asparagine--tRNA ligase [Longimicrobiales bacterium]
MSDITEIRHLGRREGGTAQLRGWVQTTRAHGKVAFVVIRDGTGIVQCVVVKKEVSPEAWELVQSLTLESSVAITGSVRADDRAPGGYEVGVQDITLIGASGEDYPIQPKEHGVDFLLDNRHLWLRSSQQRAIMKVRHEVEQALHDFFYERGFLRVDTPILTGAIGEGGAGLFEVDYFEETAYLAQTGQLYGEAAAAAFGRIYVFGPTFRAEKSKTRRHLTEFWMCEPEMAWYDSEDSMKLQEEFVSYLVARALERCAPELALLERDTTALARVKPPFPRLDYTDAVAILQEKGHDIKWGDDLGAPDETVIGEMHDRPVFIMNYPKAAKAFYMKENPADPRTVLCNDLIAPEGYGEIIGGSQREDDHDRLLARIREEKLPEDSYKWYLDLRKYGTFTHSGFGLGLERTIAWITGRPHIREMIAFPRMLNRLYP